MRATAPATQPGLWQVCSRKLSTPLGPMLAVADERGLVLCEFHDRPMLPLQLRRVQSICGVAPEEGEHPVLTQTQRELDEYFLGKRDAFTIPLVLEGSEFQRSVWRELLAIPFGKTTRSPPGWAGRAPLGPWGGRTATTGSRSSSPATA